MLGWGPEPWHPSTRRSHRLKVARNPHILPGETLQPSVARVPNASMPVFHPATAAWFSSRFAAPTAAQARAWPAIRAGKHTLVAAPTGSGKTLAAFLAAIDGLVIEALAGELPDETRVVYVSPLKALSNDIRRNLEAPLAGIGEALRAQGLPAVEIRSSVRTGDTPAAERERMRRRPPHIVVTTPESLYILLGSPSGRAMLSTTRTVIIDEIHALAPNKRGAHLALSLERLEALAKRPLLRIGLSATQKPLEAIANFLVGTQAAASARRCTIVDAGHQRARALALEVPGSPLEAVMSAEVWGEVYDRLTELIAAHRTTLVFVNTRRMAERVAHELTRRLGEDRLAAHHGSLAKGQRLDAERRLQRGELNALVATASLELGIDIGEVDLVCQLGSPRSIASFLQRVGRSGHALDRTPNGRLFPLSRDDLVECAALIDSAKRGELDTLTIPDAPSDVLAQQIVAEVAARECGEEELFRLLRRAWPFRQLRRARFDAVVAMLAEGYSGRTGRRGAIIHRDAVNGVLRGRRGARLTALTSGGTIPDNADYRVVLEPESLVIGTVNEDFAVESLAGDVFQLGNTAYRILRVERGLVRVEDARGEAPTIPFWLGEAPGRSDELSAAVSRLRAEAERRCTDAPEGAGVRRWLEEEVGVGAAAARQLADYLGSARAALGALPTQRCLIFERFFDEAGGMQLVIHSPYGSRINRAWGLALRKRFCRKFNFELQAAATEDNIILSLTTAHSFALHEVARYLHANSVRDVLIQALLDAPMFITRWRRVAAVSLALPRYRGGRRVSPQIARMHAEDLIASVFPDQLACAENLVGEREIPDHPLVAQTIADCLNEAMDIDGLQRLLTGLETGEIRLLARDVNEPSPLAQEVLSARPYAYLDDAPLEERRARAVASRRWLDIETASDLGRLDEEAIARVAQEAWPEAASRDELHDALLWLGFLTETEVDAGQGWRAWLEELATEKRAGRLAGPAGSLWIAAERGAEFTALWPATPLPANLAVPAARAERMLTRAEAALALVRGRLEGSGPVTPASLAAPVGLSAEEISEALAGLERQGFAMRGRFTPGAAEEEWCERRLLARINRYTLKRLRAEIQPVAARDFLRFLFAWQRAAPETRMEGEAALADLLAQLEGFEAPAGAWEGEILPARLAEYDPAWLDALCLAGRVTWARLRPAAGLASGGARRPSPIKSTPIALVARSHAAAWASHFTSPPTGGLGASAATIAEFLSARGASFFAEIVTATRLLRCQAEDGIAELVALGLVNSDGFAGLRALLTPADRRRSAARAHRRRLPATCGMEAAGRWALIRLEAQAAADAEHIARTLLHRYGVVFRRVIDREAGRLPPWRDLLPIYRRLESRGEIRGGRFVAGFSGEQFAVPEALGLLREVRQRQSSGSLISVSAADPLNLVGILTPGPRIAALTGNRLLYRDGLPVAIYAGGEVTFLATLERGAEWEARNALLRSAQGAADALRGAA
jgi:ATP-dependent Lhr-like helicase